MKYFYLSLLLIYTVSCGVQKPSKISDINITKISGEISGYKGIYKTGMFTYFDAIGRIPKDIIFDINKDGTFNIEFYLAHPIIGSAYFDVEGSGYVNFYLEPNKNYHVVLNDGSIIFQGKNSAINSELKSYYKALNSNFENQLKEATNYHLKNYEVAKYLNYHKKLEKAQLAFLEDYSEKNRISKKSKSIIANRTKYKTAHFWVNYRYDYSNGRISPRKNIGYEFYRNLLAEYPVQSINDCESRECNDYISNLAKVWATISNTESISYFDKYASFGEKDKSIFIKYLKGELSPDSNDFKEFIGREGNEAQLNKLFARITQLYFLDNVEGLEKGPMRDLIISHGIMDMSDKQSTSISELYKDRLSSLIQNDDILTYLLSSSFEKSDAKHSANVSKSDSQKTTLQELQEKYFKGHEGKIVYIDFYATWCGPCRIEVPYAKRLYKELKDDIVFINFCAQSEKEDYDKYVKQKELDGYNYFLADNEYKVLSQYFKIRGFPSYVILDKSGKTVTNNAPRPSTNLQIIRKLRELHANN